MLLSDAVLSESLLSLLAESLSESACILGMDVGPRGEGLRHEATCSLDGDESQSVDTVVCTLASLGDCDGCVRMCSRLSRWRVHSGGGELRSAGFVFMLRWAILRF